MNFKSLLLLFCLFLALLPNAFPRSAATDSIAEAGVRKLTDNFINLFTLSDHAGSYNPGYESRLYALFDEDAMVFNFWPRTREYQQEIDLQSFVSNLGELRRSFIIQATDAAYHIREMEKLGPAGPYEARVIFTSEVFFYTMEFDSEGTVNISAELTVLADPVANEYKITGIERYSPGLVDLNFRFMLAGRQALGGLEFVFTYPDPEGGEKVVRPRTSDPEGRVDISLVPADVLLHITPPNGFVFVMHEQHTAADWEKIPVNERILFLEDSRIPGAVYLQGGIYRDLMLNELGFMSGMNFEADGHSRELVPGAGLFLHAGIRVLGIGKSEIFVGSGIRYTEGGMASDFEELKQEFPGLVDVDKDTFNLRIQARDLHENYYRNTLAVPVFLTYRYRPGIKILHSVDLTAMVAYDLSETFSFESTLTQETSGYYPEFRREFRNLPPPYHYGERQIDEEQPLEGSIRQNQRISAGLQLGVSLGIIPSRLFLHPMIQYDLLRLGQVENEELSPGKVDDGFDYIPSLGYSRITYGNMRLGIGLMFAF